MKINCTQIRAFSTANIPLRGVNYPSQFYITIFNNGVRGDERIFAVGNAPMSEIVQEKANLRFRLL